jgi:hypothetical protein
MGSSRAHAPILVKVIRLQNALFSIIRVSSDLLFLSVSVLLRFSLSAAQRSWASLRAILPQGISQVTTPSSPAPAGASTDPPAEVRGLTQLCPQ